jgi:hypothetical protein
MDTVYKVFCRTNSKFHAETFHATKHTNMATEHTRSDQYQSCYTHNNVAFLMIILTLLW